MLASSPGGIDSCSRPMANPFVFKKFGTTCLAAGTWEGSWKLQMYVFLAETVKVIGSFCMVLVPREVSHRFLLHGACAKGSKS